MSATEERVRDSIGDRVRMEAREYLFGLDTGSTHAASMTLRDVLAALVERDAERIELIDKLADAERVADDQQTAADDYADALRYAADELGALREYFAGEHRCSDEDSLSVAYLEDELERIALNMREALS